MIPPTQKSFQWRRDVRSQNKKQCIALVFQQGESDIRNSHWFDDFQGKCDIPLLPMGTPRHFPQAKWILQDAMIAMEIQGDPCSTQSHYTPCRKSQWYIQLTSVESRSSSLSSIFTIRFPMSHIPALIHGSTPMPNGVNVFIRWLLDAFGISPNVFGLRAWVRCSGGQQNQPKLGRALSNFEIWGVGCFFFVHLLQLTSFLAASRKLLAVAGDHAFWFLELFHNGLPLMYKTSG